MTSKIEDGKMTFSLKDKIIMSNSDALKNQIKKNILDETKSSEINILEFDLKDVEFIDSTGVGVFISLFKFSNENDMEMSIVNTQDMVKKIFTITKLDTLLNIK
ncbi:STAS domain-containing protein [Fusibacter tunisiensis]|jgi:anti-anti-sigma factor|uniref:Anti-sigma factor antagonist n=1 Tax=Fusibacter tunisiensis TaxID=1008308 RepID=A0ABS2MTB4_9FIRM|nr:STAS domain-containing protein [Fusibacter tunisiensis]MBM7562658.1 anti-anti-sigma factor [Fusibacter tunisiensis]